MVHKTGNMWVETLLCLFEFECVLYRSGKIRGNASLGDGIENGAKERWLFIRATGAFACIDGGNGVNLNFFLNQMDFKRIVFVL